MNAQTPFVLSGEPITDLSRLDCSDVENVKDALHQLRRCSTPADYQRWAQTWGENLCLRAEDALGWDSGAVELLAEAEADAKRAEAARDSLKLASERAERALDQIVTDFDLGPKLEDAIMKVANLLEAARVEA